MENLITKSITYLVVFLGVLFTLWVMNDDNPAEMSYEQQKQWAIVEAKEQGLQATKTATELNAIISERTREIAEEKTETLWNDVSTLINFSMITIYVAVGLVLLAFLYLAAIDMKKALRILIGVGVFTLFMVIVYFTSDGGGDPDMKLASTAINATGILIGIAILGWIGGSVVKFIR